MLSRRREADPCPRSSLFDATGSAQAAGTVPAASIAPGSIAWAADLPSEGFLCEGVCRPGRTPENGRILNEWSIFFFFFFCASASPNPLESLKRRRTGVQENNPDRKYYRLPAGRERRSTPAAGRKTGRAERSRTVPRLILRLLLFGGHRPAAAGAFRALTGPI